METTCRLFPKILSLFKYKIIDVINSSKVPTRAVSVKTTWEQPTFFSGYKWEKPVDYFQRFYQVLNTKLLMLEIRQKC